LGENLKQDFARNIMIISYKAANPDPLGKANYVEMPVSHTQTKKKVPRQFSSDEIMASGSGKFVSRCCWAG
jgi:hypothetical protein